MFLKPSYHTSFVLDIKQDKLTYSLMMKCKIRLSNNVTDWIDWSSVFSAMQGYVVVFLLIHECMHTHTILGFCPTCYQKSGWCGTTSTTSRQKKKGVSYKKRHGSRKSMSTLPWKPKMYFALSPQETLWCLTIIGITYTANRYILVHTPSNHHTWVGEIKNPWLTISWFIGYSGFSLIFTPKMS